MLYRLSWREFSMNGHDGLHVRDLGLQAADDHVIFAEALDTARIIVSADTDFATLLALKQAAKPSFVLIRHSLLRRPAQQATLLLRNLPALKEPLIRGSIVVFEESRVGIRRLPLR